MRGTITFLVICSAWGCAGSRDAGGPDRLSTMTVPRYTEDGELLRPTGVDEWVFVGASIGLGYREAKDGAGGEDHPGLIHSVQLQPEAYAWYRETGTFPEKTMLALSLYKAKAGASIARKGYFSGELVALEVALKDSQRFDDGWAYFDLGEDRTSAAAKPSESCFACHAAHGAHDNVFVQFYPILRDRR